MKKLLNILLELITIIITIPVVIVYGLLGLINGVVSFYQLMHDVFWGDSE